MLSNDVTASNQARELGCERDGKCVQSTLFIKPKNQATKAAWDIPQRKCCGIYYTSADWRTA